jgi:hypothetical protein
MPEKTKVVSRGDMGSQELTEEIIRIRAYQLFEKRGYEHGHDVEDWLEAEAEIMGRKPSAAAEETRRFKKAAGVAA